MGLQDLLMIVVVDDSNNFLAYSCSAQLIGILCSGFTAYSRDNFRISIRVSPMENLEALNIYFLTIVHEHL